MLSAYAVSSVNALLANATVKNKPKFLMAALVILASADPIANAVWTNPSTRKLSSDANVAIPALALTVNMAWERRALLPRLVLYANAVNLVLAVTANVAWKRIILLIK